MPSTSRPLPSDLPESPPEPDRRPEAWWADWARWLRRDPDRRWGRQLLRISSDMILICDESLEVLHHNRAFLKGVGHARGSFRGRNLRDFFPDGEGGGVAEAFEEWRSGHAAGMRFQASLLTTGGRRPCDFRVVRSRSGEGRFRYYLVARETPGARRPQPGRIDEEVDPFFRGLPVAAWRTDAHLRITHAYGSLWPELGLASEDLLGEAFGRPRDSQLPALLRGIDCGGVLAGTGVQKELERNGEPFQVVIEPVFGARGELAGTIGLLRRVTWRRVEGTDRRPAPLHRLRHHSAPAAAGGVAAATRRIPVVGDRAGEIGRALPKAVS